MTDKERARAIYDEVMTSAQVTTHFEVFGLDWLPETIAAAIAAARADEREAAAKVAEDLDMGRADNDGDAGFNSACYEIAAAIRSRT